MSDFCQNKAVILLPDLLVQLFNVVRKKNKEVNSAVVRGVSE